MSDDTPRKKFQVIDRRSFTSDGELKPPSEIPAQPAPAPAPAPAAAPAEANAPAAPPEPAVESGAPHRALTFSDLVDFFAQQTVLLLSGQGQPDRGVELESARYLIDLLAVVEEKSREQLSFEEKRYIEHVLFQLRTLYVAASR